LSESKYNVEEIVELYNIEQNITSTTRSYCLNHNIEYDDSIRRYFSKLLKKADNGEIPTIEGYNPRVMVYDIETSLVDVQCFWTGEQYINHKQVKSEPRIITVAWKWLGEDKVNYLTWDKQHSDKKLMSEFLDEYNQADMVIGVNNDKFDNKWINTRAAKYSMFVNTQIKSFDLQKQCRRIFRMPSYSMDYTAKFFNVVHKQSHEGIIMWEKIQKGTPKEQKEYLKKMVDYNIGDILTTEAILHRLRPYMGNKLHFGVLKGGEKYSCPECGSLDLDLVKTSVTVGGTIQRLMKCNVDGVQFKLSNREYFKYLAAKQEESI